MRLVERQDPDAKGINYRASLLVEGAEAEQKQAVSETRVMVPELHRYQVRSSHG
jgi:hypothetical protein